ncbi:MAG: pantetheine-phosphate adenylyltransferase [Elusimicrobiaceae bacterium]|nr:pantetheine-phosphate adenylyltransferase [Elusimicrobiaceae bacterium]
MSKKIAVYQGTFDPFTQGHLAVVQDALSVFDEVCILLLVNPAKKPLFSVKERKEMIEQTVCSLPRVWVDSYEGLLADYMQERGLVCSVRGVRNEQDYAYELENHQLSKNFYPQLQTFFLPCAPQWSCVSSGAVKAACVCGKLPSSWVSDAVAKELLAKFPQVRLI